MFAGIPRHIIFLQGNGDTSMPLCFTEAYADPFMVRPKEITL